MKLNPSFRIIEFTNSFRNFVVLPDFNRKSLAIINGCQSWRDVVNSNGILNSGLEIRNCGDIHPFNHKPNIFSNVKTLFVKENVDKNFVYYWLNNNTFPSVKNIYLMAHPCDYPVLRRFRYGGVSTAKIFLEESYQRYKNRWASDLDNVILMSRNEIYEIRDGYKEEELIFQ